MEKADFIVTKGTPYCISSGFDKLRSAKFKKVIKKQIKTVEGTKKRDFKLVSIDEFDPLQPTSTAYSNMGYFWADVVTGTLYHPETGECLSSTQIRIIP